MLRAALIAVFAFAACASAAAQEQGAAEDRARVEAEAPMADVQRDGFVVSGDQCGASRYSHLLGENYAELYHASLVPADASVVNRSMLRTLEYTPARLNVVLNGEGRIVAIGCF